MDALDAVGALAAKPPSCQSKPTWPRLEAAVIWLLAMSYTSNWPVLVLRNTKTGQFEVYDIANNQITAASSLGQVGLDWQLGGFAANAPTASSASMGDSSQVGRLVQAMASFGAASGAADGLNIAALGADTSQQPFLTTPQHA